MLFPATSSLAGHSLTAFLFPFHCVFGQRHGARKASLLPSVATKLAFFFFVSSYVLKFPVGRSRLPQVLLPQVLCLVCECLPGSLLTQFFAWQEQKGSRQFGWLLWFPTSSRRLSLTIFVVSETTPVFLGIRH